MNSKKKIFVQKPTKYNWHIPGSWNPPTWLDNVINGGGGGGLELKHLHQTLWNGKRIPRGIFPRSVTLSPLRSLYTHLEASSWENSRSLHTLPGSPPCVPFIFALPASPPASVIIDLFRKLFPQLSSIAIRSVVHLHSFTFSSRLGGSIRALLKVFLS